MEKENKQPSYYILGIATLAIIAIPFFLSGSVKPDFNPCCGQYGYMCYANNITYDAVKDTCTYRGQEVTMDRVQDSLQQSIERPNTYYIARTKRAIN